VAAKGMVKPTNGGAKHTLAFCASNTFTLSAHPKGTMTEKYCQVSPVNHCNFLNVKQLSRRAEMTPLQFKCLDNDIV